MELQKAGVANVEGLIINAAAGASSPMLLGNHVRLPVLQDVGNGTVWSQFSAGKDTVVVLDANWFVFARWPLISTSQTGAELAAEQVTQYPGKYTLEAAIRAAAND